MRHSQRRISIGTPTIALMMVLGLSLCSVALAQGEKATAFDIAILIDTSGSTRLPSGVDVNGNGIVGRKSFFKETITDPGDSVLAAELMAVKKLLAQLDNRTVRVAIISFSGDYLPGTGQTGNRTFLLNPATPDAFLVQPLTNDFRLASSALDQIERGGSFGGTNIAEGIQLATSELTGSSNSSSTHRREAKKVILLLTDGLPTFPVACASVSDPEDHEAAVASAKEAGRLGIQVNTFPLGKAALKVPYTVKEAARLTGGQFTPVANPGDIIKVLPNINLITPKVEETR